MSRGLVRTVSKRLQKPRVAATTGQRVARIFVPDYHAPAAIRLRANTRTSFARRQLARLIGGRRVVS